MQAICTPVETKKRNPTEKVRINKAFVESINTPGEYRDDRLTGFRLRVTNSGKKVFFVEAVVRGTRNGVSVKVGSADKWSAEQARKSAEDLLHQMSRGINPNTKRKEDAEKEKREAAIKQLEEKSKLITIGRVYEDYKRARTNLSPKTIEIYTYVINSKLRDWLHLSINDITREMVEDRHKEISQKHKGEADHAMRILRALFNYAADKYRNHLGQSLVVENPVRVLSINKSWNKLPRRKTVIKSYQLRAWYQAVIKLENDTVRDYLLTMLFTGLRKTAAATLEWKNIDLKDNTLKTTEKGGKEVTLPIPKTVQDILRVRKKTTKGKYVFPAQNKDGYQKDIRYHEDLIEAASGVKFTPHVLRYTFITIASQICTQYQLKQLVSHTDSSDVTLGYIIADIEELRKPLERVENMLLRAIREK